VINDINDNLSIHPSIHSSIHPSISYSVALNITAFLVASCQRVPINKTAIFPFPVRRIWILHFAFFSRSPLSLFLCRTPTAGGNACFSSFQPCLSATAGKLIYLLSTLKLRLKFKHRAWSQNNNIV